ncbi:helix-turn-helix domain-containing protein [Halosimplex pelagicum]|uniref:Helix-turn-helix domain-containing protein n=1 Tax=Halosimplex pelagicum TaxID=869886 RepID=A0A7D5TBY3_9EURY|nr:helix-turn-helix domain-containing protein [Halosimplex pelagicum]QLH84150.1 helix-turn-helix domain-containing protein [Halosimplex pelagicum]
MIDECLVVEFRVTGDDCPLARASVTADATVDADPPQLRTDGNALVRASGAADTGVAAALDGDDRVRYLHVARAGDRETYRCLSKAPCVVHELTDAGFLAESLRYRAGEEYHRGAVVGREVLQGVIDAADERVGVTVERASPLAAEGEEGVAAHWNLTPAQVEAVEAALERGYFAVPREATAADVAADLGISKSAFLERVHRAEAALFGGIFG